MNDIETSPAANGGPQPGVVSPQGSSTPTGTEFTSMPNPRVSRSGTTPVVGAEVATYPTHVPPRLLDPILGLRADILDDIERTRMANVNRLSVMTRPAGELDEDGHARGWGLPAGHPEILAVRTLVDGLERLEHEAVLQLQRAMRKHPLGPWVKGAIGIGEKQGARLLATIGDPYWNTLHNRPRTVSELWAYCGLHTLPSGDIQEASDPHPFVNVAARRKRGVKSNWSGAAKMRAYLCAESCVKQSRSPFRKVYDERRAHTAITHPDWTAGHSHNDALRIVSKAILKDLWIAARELY